MGNENESYKIDTINRRIPEGFRAIDLSLRGSVREWFMNQLENRTFSRSLGVIFHENPASRVILG